MANGSSKVIRPDWYAVDDWNALSKEERKFVIENLEETKKAYLAGMEGEDETGDADETGEDAGDDSDDKSDDNADDETGDADDVPALSQSETEKRERAAAVFAEKANDDDETETLMRDFVTKKEDIGHKPISLMFHLRNVYGDDLNATPVPGSTTGNNPDVYKKSIVKADGTKGTKKGSFVEDVVVALNYGREVRDNVMEIRQWKSGKGKFASLGKTQADSLKKRYEAQWSGILSLFRKALGLHHQFEAAKSLKLVKVYWLRDDKIGTDGKVVKDKDGKPMKVITRSPSPIGMHEIEEAANARSMSISQFLSLDIKAAIGAGGTLAALTNTLPGAGNAGGPGEETAIDRKTAESYLAKLTHYLEQDENQMAIERRLNVRKPEESRDLLFTLFSLKEILTDLTARHAPRYAKEVLAESKRNNADAKEKKVA